VLLPAAGEIASRPKMVSETEKEESYSSFIKINQSKKQNLYALIKPSKL
jgi:hypothetical protein